MAVGVPRRRQHLPSGDLVPGIDEDRVPGEPDEVGEDVSGVDQVLGDAGRHAVAQEPAGDPLRPVARAPDALALGVVEPSLQHGRSEHACGLLRPADVIRVHVRDEDPDDRSVELGRDLLPRRLRQSEPRVHEHPAVLVAHEIRVDVARPARQRQGHAQDARLELDRHTERMFASLRHGDARRVSRRALPLRVEPRAGYAVRVVAQPVHGLRPPLHVLLRAGVRGARRPARGRPLRDEHPREDERGRGAAARAGTRIVGARAGRYRRRHRPVPAGRGPLPAHPRLHRGARRRGESVRGHHARAV